MNHDVWERVNYDFSFHDFNSENRPNNDPLRLKMNVIMKISIHLFSFVFHFHYIFFSVITEQKKKNLTEKTTRKTI